MRWDSAAMPIQTFCPYAEMLRIVLWLDLRFRRLQKRVVEVISSLVTKKPLPDPLGKSLEDCLPSRLKTFPLLSNLLMARGLSWSAVETSILPIRSREWHNFVAFILFCRTTFANLFAEERRDILIRMSVPVLQDAAKDQAILEVTLRYFNTITRKMLMVLFFTVILFQRKMKCVVPRSVSIVASKWKRPNLPPLLKLRVWDTEWRT